MINPSRAAQPADRSAVSTRSDTPYLATGIIQTPKTICLQLAAPCSLRLFL